MSSNASLRVLAVHSVRSVFRRNFHRTSVSLTITSGCWRVVSPRTRSESIVCWRTVRPWVPLEDRVGGSPFHNDGVSEL